MQAAGLEVEPLEMVALGIGADRQQGLERVAEVDHLDVAAVEVGTDVEGGFSHGRVPDQDFYGGHFTRKRGALGAQKNRLTPQGACSLCDSRFAAKSSNQA